MKRSIIFISLLITFVTIFRSNVQAAPAPWGIAINENKQECAGYWAGDEFTAYPLPSGWKDYYPDFLEGEMTISTPAGSCIFESEESCCNQLGYEYVSDNIGRDYNEKEPLGGLIDPTVVLIIGGAFCCFTTVLIISLIVFFTMIRKKK